MFELLGVLLSSLDGTGLLDNVNLVDHAPISVLRS